MTLLIALFIAIVQAEPAPTVEMLRARAQERMRQDAAIYSADELRALEDLYQSANKDLRAPTARDALMEIVKKYPKSNRAGSAVLYLAQMTTGDEREAYLKTAITTYGDTWYGDGVQVGAFGRAQLAVYYATHDRLAEGKALAKEVMDKFPGAVDHRGKPLLDTLRALKLIG
jgi:uncharacterized protein (DUF1810 family)